MYTNCKRCGRALKSEESRRRGYGSYCYSKLNEVEDNKNSDINNLDNEEDIQIDGQISLLEEVI